MLSFICFAREDECMKSIIPFTKEITFDSKIAEITSISLEHEIHLKEHVLEGDFIVTGEYKSHEISVNKEPFSYRLPFQVELSEHIAPGSVTFEIHDFTYDVESDNILKVNIEFLVCAEEIEEEEPDAEEDPIEDRIDPNLFLSPDEAFDTPIDLPILKEEPKKEAKAETIDPENETTIIETINGVDDAYATYHVHIVREGENIETICTMYHSNIDVLSDYNDVGNINIGDKIIIPFEADE